MSYLTDRINEVREEKNKKDSYLQNKINQVKEERAKKGQYTGSGYGGFGQQRTIVPGLYDLAVQKQSKVSSASAFEERYPEYMAQFQRGTETGAGTPVSTRQPGGGGVAGGGFGAHGARAEHTPGENAARGSNSLLGNYYNAADNRLSNLYGGTYGDILNREDYAEMSRAGESTLGRGSETDRRYDYINDINGFRARADEEAALIGDSQRLGKYGFMTEDEIGVYNYLYATQGRNAANQFLDQLDPELNRQYYSGVSSYETEQALENPGFYSAMTVLQQPLRSATSRMAVAEDIYRTATGQGIDPYSELRQTSRLTSDVRRAIGENSEFFRNMALYNPDMQNAALTYEQFSTSGQENPFAPENIDTETARQIGNFAYQTAMSAADSAMNSFMAQGYAGVMLPGLDLRTKAGVDKLMKATNAIGAITMSSEVASLGVAEAKEKGYSDLGALGVGLVRGVIEFASEAIGGEWAIRNIQKDPLNVVKTMLMNMVPEGVEEVMSDVGNEAFNLIIDAIFGTQESELVQLYNHYVEQGDDNPWWSVVKDVAWNEIKSFLGGALATVGTTGVQTVNFNRGVNAASQRLNTTRENVVQLMNDYQTESPGDIYEMAERLNARNEAELRQKAGEGKTAEAILEEARKSDEGNKDKFQGVAQAFRDAGIPLTNSEIRTLTSGMEAGTADAETYYSAVRDAYRLGMNGNFTLAEAIRATDSAAKISETQFRHAFELGQLKAGKQNATADTADTQTRLDSALAVLGNENAQIAAQAYQEGQDIDSYAAAMYKAAALYAANGRDLRTIAQQARSGQISDIVGRLTDAQVETAIQIGQQMAAQSEQQVQKATQRFQSLREQAAAVQNSVVKGNVTVATKGGTIDGIKYDAVDESKLSEKQKQIISAVGAVADVLGLNVTVVSGQGGFGGAYTGKGNIFLNINSGMNLRGFSKAIAAGSFAHEMTHWLAEYAPTEYEALRKIVTASMTEEQIDSLVQEQQRVQPNLTYDEAMNEVVANACQPLLKDSKAFEQIARENMTLAERILDFLKEFTQKIHDAFADIDFKDNLPIYHAAQAVESHLDEMQKAFDKAIVAARENMAAERAANENTASEGGVQLQKWTGEKLQRKFIGYSQNNITVGETAIDEKVRSLIERGKTTPITVEEVMAQEGKADWSQFGAARQYVRDTLSSIFGQDSVFISDNGTTVEAYLTKDGRRHSAAYINSKVKAATLFKAHEIITKAEYVFSSQYDDHSTTGKKYKGAIWDYYVAVATYGRFNIPVRFTMIDSAKDAREQIYKIGIRTEDASLTNREQNNLGARSNAGEASSDNRIAETGEEVKTPVQKQVWEADPRVDKTTEQGLRRINSTATDGVVVSDELAALMKEEGFSKPVDPMDQLDAQYQVWTTDDWESNYLTSGGDLTVAAQIRDFTNAMIADDAIMGYVPAGHYQKSRFGPLRKNIEYRWTFDMDASCPRTFQFVNYRNALQTIAGRPLTDSEAMNLLYLMRRMNQQIPCTYCYVENKRIMKSKSYLDWFQARADVMSAATDEEALKKMYSYDAKKGTVGAAAQKVFDEWRADVKAGKAYYPSAQEVWTGWNTAKNTVFNFLDKGLENGVIRFGEGVKKATTQKKMVDAVCKRFGVTDKAARREIEGFVAKWRYDVLAGTKHVYDVVNDTSVDTINQDILRLNRLASNYASSVSQARLVDDYIPYTDQLKNVSKADKEYIMGMGGIRKHSSNDFRMDYVQDYFLFYADLAAGGWTGHTYTKSVDYCKVFGRTGDRINLSIAMNTENGKIVENQQEGAAWKDARELRKAYKDLGVMAMVTDNAQLSFALNNDWIDMCIPFHASGLPKAVWYNLRAWSDYTSVQLESYFTSEEMKQRLRDAGVNIKGLKSEEIEALFNSTFNIPVVLNQNGQRVKPHFFPSDTVVYGPGGVKQVIPGHHNDAQRYFELCEQYGVHPRFYGTKVTDADGNVIDVTEHPNYVKLIKETSRTDTEQEPIKFNFNEKDEYLGMTPMEYAMQRMQEEAKIGGYKNTAADPLGIVDMFKELYLGKNRDIGWMPADTDESPAAERLRTALEITQSAYNEMYDADVQTLDTEGYQKVLTQQTTPKALMQVWNEGDVYNDRALVSEETLDKWMSSGWYGSSNPDYAQAFITSMSPSQFLKLTTMYDEGRVRAETTDNSIDRVMASSESQPIQLMIDTETGKVVGHEGRHRMVALERNGVYEVPVLLFDSGNKYSKKAMKEFVLHGQDFHGQKNYQQATVFDVYPLNQSHRQQIVNLYSKKSFSEQFKERNNGTKTVQFQQWDMTDDDTTTERKGRETAYARLQSENAVLRETVKELKRLSGKQKTTLANIQRQLQLTKDPETRLSDAKKLARSILKEYSSTADANSVAEAVKTVGDYLLNTNTDEVTEAELKSRARAAAMEVLDNASETLSFDEGDIEVNPYDAYIGEASEDLANRIVMDAMDGVLRPTAPTRADKQQARTQALKDRIQQLKAENKLEQREAARLYQTIYDLSLQLDKAQSRYETLRQKAEYREAEVRRQGAARAAEIKATERARAEGLLEEQKQHYLDIAKRARQRRENTTSRAKIRRLIDELNRRLAKPTEKRYVPQELIRLTVDILSVIDVDSGRGGENFAQKLERLRTMYDSYQKDPRYAAVYDEVAAEMLRDMCVKIGDTKLYSMNESQLETVYNTLKALTHIINDAIKVRIGTEERNAFEVAQEMTGETRQIPKAQRGWLKQHLLPAMLDPLRAFRRFGGNKMNSAWESVARMLDQGQLKQTDITMRLSMPFAELVNNAAAMRDFTGVNFFNHVDPKKLIDIGLKDENGNPVMVTHGIAAGIYMDLLNEDNRRHFIRGGKTVPNLKDYYTGRGGFGMGTTRAVGISTELSELYHEQREAKAEGDLSRVEDLQTQIDELMSDGESYADEVQRKIESQLTDFDKKWIAATQQLMDKEGKRYLNETTMDVYGIEKATVDHYYPITSDPNYLASNFESITRDMNLENVGFMKERVQSGNPTLAMDISSVVNEQIRRVAQYSGLMPAIRNFNKIWNKQSFGYSDSLKQAVNDVFGKEGRQYVENIIADLNGSRSVGEDSLGIGRLFGWLRGNLAQTSLTLNLRVALAQAASYPTAAAELGAGPLAKAFLRGGKKGRIISRADQELIAKYSPLLWYRMQGYSSIELGDIKNSQRLSSRIWKKARWATGWIQAVDGATVGRLWYAAEYWVQENMPSLEKGSEEYYQEVAKKFNDVVEKTQPNYTTMQRPQILRDPNEMVKMLTMFMTQRLQNFNILYDAAATYQKARADKANNRNGVTQADVAEARQDLTRAVASQLTAAAVYVGFGFLADAIYRNMKPYRDDDDGELTAESVSMALLDKYIDAIVGMVIGGSELHSILKAVTGNGKWYGLSLNGVDSLNDLIDDIVTLSSTDYDLSDEKSKAKFEKQLLKTVLSICQALGIPANNGIKIKNAIMNTITDAANGEFWSFNAGYNVTTAQQKLRDLEALGFSKDEAQQLLKDANTNGNSSISQEELYNYIQSHPDLTDEQILGLWNAQGWKTDYATYNAKQQKKATTAPDTSAPAAPAKGSTAAGGAKPAAESVAAAAEPDATQSTGITTYEQFYIVAPIYDTAKRTSVYGAWETALKPSGMSLQRFLDFLNAANVDGNNNIKKDEMGFALYDAMDRGEMTMAQAEAVWNGMNWAQDLQGWRRHHHNPDVLGTNN